MYRLYTKLEKEKCIKLLKDSLFDSKFYFFFAGYIGSVQGDSFWASSRTKYKLEPNGISYAPAMNFDAMVSKCHDETVIEGEFKFSKFYRVGFGIWLSVLCVFFLCILAFFFHTLLIQGEFDFRILFVAAILPIFGASAWLLMFQFNAKQCEDANQDTFEFLKTLLEIYEIEQ